MKNDILDWITDLGKTLNNIGEDLGVDGEMSTNTTFLNELNYVGGNITNFITQHATEITIGIIGGILSTAYYRSHYIIKVDDIIGDK
jgi:hypothetical protein